MLCGRGGLLPKRQGRMIRRVLRSRNSLVSQSRPMPPTEVEPAKQGTAGGEIPSSRNLLGALVSRLHPVFWVVLSCDPEADGSECTRPYAYATKVVTWRANTPAATDTRQAPHQESDGKGESNKRGHRRPSHRYSFSPLPRASPSTSVAPL